MQSTDHIRCLKCDCNRNLLCAYSGLFVKVGNCDHIFCEDCFRKDNYDVNNQINKKFGCPFCKEQFYNYFQTLDEAVLLGEAAFYSYKIGLNQMRHVGSNDGIHIHILQNKAIEKCEKALELNENSFAALCCLILYLNNGVHEYRHLLKRPDFNSLPIERGNLNELKYYYNRKYSCFLKLFEIFIDEAGRHRFDKPLVSEPGYYYALYAQSFYHSHNFSAAFRYSKIAYEYSIRLPHSTSNVIKSLRNVIESIIKRPMNQLIPITNTELKLKLKANIWLSIVTISKKAFIHFITKSILSYQL